MGDVIFPRYSDWDGVHPLAVASFRLLERRLQSAASEGLICKFGVFETYRSPQRQRSLARGVTKAGAFASAHQYGLAVDWVPLIDNEWTWDPPPGTWHELRRIAKDCGLINGLDWDRAHVEHPLWLRVRSVLAAG